MLSIVVENNNFYLYRSSIKSSSKLTAKSSLRNLVVSSAGGWEKVKARHYATSRRLLRRNSLNID